MYIGRTPHEDVGWDLQAKEQQILPANHQKLGERCRKMALPQPSEGTLPIPWSWTHNI